jgi:hypothetical protein
MQRRAALHILGLHIVSLAGLLYLHIVCLVHIADQPPLVAKYQHARALSRRGTMCSLGIFGIIDLWPILTSYVCLGINLVRIVSVLIPVHSTVFRVIAKIRREIYCQGVRLSTEP